MITSNIVQNLKISLNATAFSTKLSLYYNANSHDQVSNRKKLQIKTESKNGNCSLSTFPTLDNLSGSSCNFYLQLFHYFRSGLHVFKMILFQ